MIYLRFLANESECDEILRDQDSSNLPDSAKSKYLSGSCLFEFRLWYYPPPKKTQAIDLLNNIPITCTTKISSGVNRKQLIISPNLFHAISPRGFVAGLDGLREMKTLCVLSGSAFWKVRQSSFLSGTLRLELDFAAVCGPDYCRYPSKRDDYHSIYLLIFLKLRPSF